MPTLGEELRRRREERNITLTDISEATRIGTRFLKAIEADNFSVLPGGIFTRSFIRAYAREVGMNEDEAVTLYQQQITGAAAEPQQLSPAEQRERVEPRERRPDPIAVRQTPTRTSWPTIVIAAGILVFIGLIIWALVKQFNQGSQSSAPVATSQSAPPSPSPGQSAPTPSEQPSGGATTSTAPNVPAGESLVIALEAANGDSWLRYQVDEAKPAVMTLKQGQTIDLPPAQTQVKLNIGNRRAVNIKINNRQAMFPANTPNFAAQVTISRDNIQTFFQ